MSTPIFHLTNKLDHLTYDSKICCHADCKNMAITSHTLPRNILSIISADMRDILTSPIKITNLLKNKTFLESSGQTQFSTFKGFCAACDNSLFRPIDDFNGEMNNYKAVLIHYRIVCYCIYHIRTQIQKLKVLANQDFKSEDNKILADVETALENINSGHYADNLEICLQEHLKRKAILEKILNSEEYELIEYTVVSGEINNPFFLADSITQCMMVNI